MTFGSSIEKNRVVVVRRQIRASRDFLFQAWTDPARFVRWFGPKTWTVERCELDPRAGGAWRAWLKTAYGEAVYVGGVYSEFEADRRIAFTWDTHLDGRGPEMSSIVTVEFLGHTDGTEVRVTHRKLSSGQSVDMDVGWNNTLDSLEEYVRAQTAD